MTGRLAAGARAAYRAAGRLLSPALGVYLRRRAQMGKEEPERLGERLGLAGAPRPSGRLVWIHAASIGESGAVTPLARALAAQGFAILLTTGTVTSARIVAERLAGTAQHQYAPLDVEPFVRRFLDHWRPDVAILAESEIWPVTLGELERRAIPSILVNARLSDRSFRRWQSVPSLAGTLFGSFSLVLAQSPADAVRFTTLGARTVRVSGNLKGEIAAELPDPTVLAPLRAAIEGRPVWAALSTHPGEETIAIGVHRRLAARHPGLLTILVPRHVERSTTIAAEIAAAGLASSTRSQRAAPPAQTAVFLGDSTGEIGLYLALSAIVFMGKSLAGQGGQNPLEAVMAGTAVLSGPSVDNFRDVYRHLAGVGAVEFVRDEAALAAAVDRLLSNPADRASRIAAGQAGAAGLRGALAATLDALAPFLGPLRQAGRER